MFVSEFECPDGSIVCRGETKCGVLCNGVHDCRYGADEHFCNEDYCQLDYCFGDAKCEFDRGKGTVCVNCSNSDGGKRCYEKPPTTTMKSTSTPTIQSCPPSYFPCKDGLNCVQEKNFCDFRFDCPDMSDEEECPHLCNFEDFDMCRWTTENCDDCPEWTLAKSRMLKRLPHAPKFDHTTVTSKGGFAFLSLGESHPKEKQNSSLISPEFKSAGFSCKLSFWYHTFEPLGNLTVYIRKQNKEIKLWEKASYGLEQWYEEVIKLPTCLVNFRVIFRVQLGENWRGSIGVDDVRFENCELSYNQCPPASFTCDNRRCISLDKLCDFQDDCCDGSDETDEKCQNYRKCDFSTDWCGWDDLSDEVLRWERVEDASLDSVVTPPRDHTTHTLTGHYLIVRFSDQRAKLERSSIGQFFDSTGSGGCFIRFWYHLYGNHIGVLNVYKRDLLNGKPVLLDSIIGNEINEWHRQEISISSENPFQLIIEAVAGIGSVCGMAIDDFSYTQDCRDYNGPTPSQDPFPTSPPIEAIYPTDCRFEINACGWAEVYHDGFNWRRGSGHSAQHIGDHAPPFDHSRGTASGHFMYIRDATTNRASGRLANLRSPTFQKSSSECKIQFYYYINGTNAFLGLHLNLERFPTSIWKEITTRSDGEWHQVVVGIGRRDEPFMLEFISTDVSFELHQVIAIDDVSFFDCTLPSPEDKCDEDVMFWCKRTKACIPRNLLCDLTDNCGDGSDEAEVLCQPYKRFDMQHGIGEFYQGLDGTDDDFNWTSFNGSTPSHDTGPETDHTNGSSYGKYLYIETSKPRVTNEKAWLLSKPFIANRKSSKKCRVRFFFHMFGADINKLSVYIRYHRSGPPERSMWERAGQLGNYWERAEITLDEDKDFQVIVEGVAGSSFQGDIAIDDISFTPECQYRDELLPDAGEHTPTAAPVANIVAITVPVVLTLVLITVVVVVVILYRKVVGNRERMKSSSIYGIQRNISHDNPSFDANDPEMDIPQNIVNPLYESDR